MAFEFNFKISTNKLLPQDDLGRPWLRTILLSIFGPHFQLWFLYIGAIERYGTFTKFKVNFSAHPGLNTELWMMVNWFLWANTIKSFFMCKKCCFSHRLFDSVLIPLPLPTITFSFVVHLQWLQGVLSTNLHMPARLWRKIVVANASLSLFCLGIEIISSCSSCLMI